MEVLGFALIAAGLYVAKNKGVLSSLPATDFPEAPTESPTTYTRGIREMAQAIARAEGFYVVGSAPNRAHNPGALKSPGWQGPTTGSAGINVYADDQDGWNALYYQLQLIQSGRSSYYRTGMSIQQMANVWTGNTTEGLNWGANVARVLGVSTNTTIGAVLA